MEYIETRCKSFSLQDRIEILEVKKKIYILCKEIYNQYLN